MANGSLGNYHIGGSVCTDSWTGSLRGQGIVYMYINGKFDQALTPYMFLHCVQI